MVKYSCLDQMQCKEIGHNELYKMGFDGASIALMRRLTPEQFQKLFEILQQFQNENTNVNKK